MYLLCRINRRTNFKSTIIRTASRLSDLYVREFEGDVLNREGFVSLIPIVIPPSFQDRHRLRKPIDGLRAYIPVQPAQRLTPAGNLPWIVYGRRQIGWEQELHDRTGVYMIRRRENGGNGDNRAHGNDSPGAKPPNAKIYGFKSSPMTIYVLNIVKTSF